MPQRPLPRCRHACGRVDASKLIEKLLKLVRIRAVHPADPKAWVDGDPRWRQQRRGEAEAVDAFNQISRFIIDVDAAAVAPARDGLCYEKEMVLSVVRHGAATIQLTA